MKGEITIKGTTLQQLRSHLSFNEFVGKTLEHIFQCETCDKPDFWGEEKL